MGVGVSLAAGGYREWLTSRSFKKVAVLPSLGLAQRATVEKNPSIFGITQKLKAKKSLP
jgi:hypothetical protein